MRFISNTESTSRRFPSRRFVAFFSFRMFFWSLTNGFCKGQKMEKRTRTMHFSFSSTLLQATKKRQINYLGRHSGPKLMNFKPQ